MCTCQPIFDGQHVINGIATYFDDCLYTRMDIASFICGWCSILSWVIILFPTLWVNYQTKRVDGISGLFLIEWLLGDVTNIVGCILTKSLPTQTFQAMYFIAFDIGLLGQWIYYKERKHLRRNSDSHLDSLTSADYRDFESTRVGRRHSGRRNSPARTTSPTIGRNSSWSLNNHLLAVVTLCCLTSRVDAYQPSPRCSDDSNLSKTWQLLGVMLAWMSGLIYFISRLPQLWKNYERRSTNGLSFTVFWITIFGNTMYGLSIMLRRPIIDQTFYRKQLPFLIGSVGTFVFDIAIVVQFWIWGNVRVRSTTQETQESSWYTPKE